MNSTLLKLFAPVITELWNVIYAEIQTYEPKAPAAVQPIAAAVASALNTFVGTEIAKL